MGWFSFKKKGIRALLHTYVNVFSFVPFCENIKQFQKYQALLFCLFHRFKPIYKNQAPLLNQLAALLPNCSPVSRNKAIRGTKRPFTFWRVAVVNRSSRLVSLLLTTEGRVVSCCFPSPVFRLNLRSCERYQQGCSTAPVVSPELATSPVVGALCGGLAGCHVSQFLVDWEKSPSYPPSATAPSLWRVFRVRWSIGRKKCSPLRGNWPF